MVSILKRFVLQIFGTDSWTSFKDKQYEQVCEDILSAKDKIEAAWTLCREARSKKPVSGTIGMPLCIITISKINFILLYFCRYFTSLPQSFHYFVWHGLAIQSTTFSWLTF